MDPTTVDPMAETREIACWDLISLALLEELDAIDLLAPDNTVTT